MKFDLHSTCSLISHKLVTCPWEMDKYENLNYQANLWENRLSNTGQRKIDNM